MKKIYIVYFFVFLLVSCTKTYVPTWNYNGPMPVSQEQYEMDKDYFKQCFLDNSEYYRLHCRYDEGNRGTQEWKDSCNKYPDVIPSLVELFWQYGLYYNVSQNKDIDSIEYKHTAYEHYEVFVDTIIYDKSNTFALIFYSVERKVLNEEPYIRASTMYGYRETEDANLKFYPGKVTATGDDRRWLLDYVEYLWLNQPKEQYYLGISLNDPDFFETDPHFSKFDDSTYYFQIRTYSIPNYDVMNKPYNYHYGN